MFSLNPSAANGAGSIKQLPQQTLLSNFTLPTVNFVPGKLLSVRVNRKVVTIGLNGTQPAIAPTGDISAVRQLVEWDAHGRWEGACHRRVRGGQSADRRCLRIGDRDPATGKWTLGASASKPRLYHSIGLLLPDGTVLTGGGGAPGPVKNLNAEIYYPPYLYDAAGNRAGCPTLVTAPTLLQPKPGTTFTATVAAGDQVRRVTLLRTGSVTHSNNPDQNFHSCRSPRPDRH